MAHDENRSVFLKTLIEDENPILMTAKKNKKVKVIGDKTTIKSICHEDEIRPVREGSRFA